MRIRFVTSVAGARFAYDYGQKVDLPEKVALPFLRAGQAVPDIEDATETAVLAAPERAVKRRSKRGNKGGGLFH